MNPLSPLLNGTLRRKHELLLRRQRLISAGTNFLTVIVLYFIMTHNYLSDLLEIFYVPSQGIWFIERLLITIFSTNVMVNLFSYAKLSLLYTPVVLNSKQKKLLDVKEIGSGFIFQTPGVVTPQLKRALSPTFIGSPFISPLQFNLSGENNSNDSINAWQYFQPQVGLPARCDYTDLNRSRSKNSSHSDVEEKSISDEESLYIYLKEHEEAERKSLNESTSPQKSYYGYRPSSCDTSNNLRKYAYQLASRSSQISTHRPDDSDLGFQMNTSADDIWSRFGVPEKEVGTLTKNLRQWISLTILNRLVNEIDLINGTLRKMGSTDLQIGDVNLIALRQIASNKSRVIPTLSVLLPYLEISPNQEYVVKRIRDLARGGCMSEFVWNGGGNFKGRPWSDHLPTDTAIVMHVFCTYFDSRLPPHPSYPDGKTFTSQCLVRSPIKPVLGKRNLCCMCQTRLLPPHYKLITGDGVWDTAKGRNNLFHTILLFLLHVKVKEKGMLGQVNLGLSGINILWILDIK